MTDTAMVPRKNGRQPAPVIDEQLADQLLGKAQTDGVQLLGPDDTDAPGAVSADLSGPVQLAPLQVILATRNTSPLGVHRDG